MIKWAVYGVLALGIGALLWGEWMILVPMELALAGICLASPLANIVNRRHTRKEGQIENASHEAPAP